MLFGRSLFDTVLTRMEEENPRPAEPEPEAMRVRGFTTGFVAPAMEGISVSLHRIDGAYRDLAEDGEVTVQETVQPEASTPPGPPPLPAHLGRQLTEEIEHDLGLSPEDSIDMLAERRRVFARSNHPDVVHPAHREAANLRMMTANLLIDRAISRIHARRELGLI